MNFELEDLKGAVEQNILSGPQAFQLWQFLEKRQGGVSGYAKSRFKFTLLQVANYTGATLIIVALAISLVLSVGKLSYGGMLILTTVYTLGFASVGYNIWRKFSAVYQVLGGLLCTLSVGTVSLVVYSFLQLTNLFITQPPLQSSYYDRQPKAVGWLVIEFAVIGIGLGMLWFVHFPFLTVSFTVSLYILVVFTLPATLTLDWQIDQMQWASQSFAIFVLTFAYVADKRTSLDFSFWGYLYGLLALIPGLIWWWNLGFVGKAIYVLIGLALMFSAVLLSRRLMLIFGSLTLLYLVAYLGFSVFQNVWSFTVVVCLIGLSVIYLGRKYQEYEKTLKQLLFPYIPARFR